MRFISNTLMRMGVLFAQLAINAPFKLLHSSPINIRTDLENSQQNVKQKLSSQSHLSHHAKKYVQLSQDCPQYIKQYFRQLQYDIKLLQGVSLKVTLTNRNNETRTFDLNILKKNNQDELAVLENFMNPPYKISTVVQARQLLGCLTEGDFFVVSYIPEKGYSEWEKKFNEMKYTSSSTRNIYVTVRSKQLADYLRIPTEGKAIMLHKQHDYCPKHVQVLIGEDKFTKVDLQQKCLSKDLGACVNHYTHCLVQQIDHEVALYNKIRQMQMSQDPKKLLVVHSLPDSAQQQVQYDDVLKNVAAANKDHCVVMKLVSRGLLKEFLNIEADRGKNTVRLVDINSVQPGFFKPKSADKVPVWYSRGKFVGKFDEKDLSQFVTAPIKQFYQKKDNLFMFRSLLPQQTEQLENTLVVYQSDMCPACQSFKLLIGQIDKLIQKKKTQPETSVKHHGLIQRLSILRWNSLNQNSFFGEPKSMPKLFYVNNKKYIDVNLPSIYNKILNDHKVLSEEFSEQFLNKLLEILSGGSIE